MSRRVVISPLAAEDLRATYDYLFDRSPRAAVGFVEAAQRTARRLAEHPGLGRPWHHGERDLADVRSVRIAGFAAWLMVYRDRRGALRVLRVIHGARDLDTGLDLGADFSD